VEAALDNFLTAVSICQGNLSPANFGIQLRYRHVAALGAALARKYIFSMVNKTLPALRGRGDKLEVGLNSAEDYQAASGVEASKGRRL
jgi:hypothetical protein